MGSDLLVPLVDSVVVYENRFNLNGPKETLVDDGAIIYVEGDEGFA